MRLFTVFFGEAYHVPVFAYSFDGAALLFEQWFALNRKGEVPSFTVTKVKFTRARREDPHLSDALSRGVCGIGTHDPEKGWEIEQY